MMDYQIQGNARRCAASNRELRPGDVYHSVLLDQGGTFVRQDFSDDAWTGPPAGAFAFWRGRVPKETSARLPRIDGELLMDCFRRVSDSAAAGQPTPAQVNFRYVLALLLMRQKRLRFDSARTDAAGETLILRCPKSRAVYQVLNPRLTDEEMGAVQDEVFKVIGWD